MYICICKAVTERQISEAIRLGAGTRKEISACLKAGTGCGKCNPEIRDLLSRGRPEQQNLSIRRATEAVAYPRDRGGVREVCLQVESRNPIERHSGREAGIQ